MNAETIGQTDYPWIAEHYRQVISTQSYRDRASIDGVRVIDLQTFSDEGGDFCEIARLDETGELACLPGYRPAQISYSLMEPGAIKAWHLHGSQDDLWFVPPHERLLVGLLDVREGSASADTALRLTLGAGRARLLYIPRGVAHGVANLSIRPASLVYFANSAFNPEDPDEHRLPHDLLGADFWSIRPG
jgi:dTDP-4-dehydrorhamnose 3,5-epimerase